MNVVFRPGRFGFLMMLGCGGLVLPSTGAERELIRDPHFQNGFQLLEPRPGKRVVYGQCGALGAGRPAWDLAQWSSRFPVQPPECFSDNQIAGCTNTAKRVLVGVAGSPAADLSLAVWASSEYGSHPRRSTGEPWVHLLVQQDFENPPLLGELAALHFRLEARLKHSSLATTNGYSPSLHAAQYLVYLTVANRNPDAPGFGECFWFGIPVYDNRSRVVPPYEARDFGDTKLFIFTLGSDHFTGKSTHDGQWVRFQKDLLPLVRQGLERAHAKGFLMGSKDLADFRPLGIFIGWEVPGVFDVDLQIRDLSLVAVARQQ
jgi:hypothetical protein